MENDSLKKVLKINKDTIKLLMINPHFMRDISLIRKKYGIEIENDYTTIEDGIISAGKYAQFLSSIKILLKKFKLSDNFLNSIKQYIFTDKMISIPASNYAIDLSGDLIKVLIYQKPSKQEWLHIKNEVNHFIDLTSKNKYLWLSENFNYPDGIKRKNPKSNIDKNIEVLKEAKKGKSDNDIEFSKYYDENSELSKKQILKNINKIRSIKRRYKDSVL